MLRGGGPQPAAVSSTQAAPRAPAGQSPHPHRCTTAQTSVTSRTLNSLARFALRQATTGFCLFRQPPVEVNSCTRRDKGRPQLRCAASRQTQGRRHTATRFLARRGNLLGHKSLPIHPFLSCVPARSSCLRPHDAARLGAVCVSRFNTRHRRSWLVGRS